MLYTGSVKKLKGNYKMETVVTVSFKEPAKTYEVLSTLKRESFNILTAGILEKENGVVTAKDGFSYDTDGDNWAIGGLWGSLIGIIGGPLGIRNLVRR